MQGKPADLGFLLCFRLCFLLIPPSAKVSGSGHVGVWFVWAGAHLLFFAIQIDAFGTRKVGRVGVGGGAATSTRSEGLRAGDLAGRQGRVSGRRGGEGVWALVPGR